MRRWYLEEMVSDLVELLLDRGEVLLLLLVLGQEGVVQLAQLGVHRVVVGPEKGI